MNKFSLATAGIIVAALVTSVSVNAEQILLKQTLRLKV